MGKNEVYLLLDNNELIQVRGDIRVDQSVSDFINILFRGGKDKNFSQAVTHEDILRLLKATELFSYVEDRFEKLYIPSDTLLRNNYWVDVHRTLKGSRSIILDMFFFYGGIYIAAGERDLFDFLVETWNTHRNPIYQLSALIILHLIGIKHVKDTQC